MANDWFNKESQIIEGDPNRPQHILRNTFGGTFGGPIRKDRLFFFAAYEGQRTADQVPTNRVVPTASLAAGELKYLCDPLGSATPDPNCTLGDPNSNGIIVDPGGNTFPGFNVVTLMPGQIASLDQGDKFGPGCAVNGTCPPTPGNPTGPGVNGLLANINGANPNALFMQYSCPIAPAAATPKSAAEIF